MGAEGYIVADGTAAGSCSTPDGSSRSRALPYKAVEAEQESYSYCTPDEETRFEGFRAEDR